MIWKHRFGSLLFTECSAQWIQHTGATVCTSCPDFTNFNAVNADHRNHWDVWSLVTFEIAHNLRNSDQSAFETVLMSLILGIGVVTQSKFFSVSPDNTPDDANRSPSVLDPSQKSEILQMKDFLGLIHERRHCRNPHQMSIIQESNLFFYLQFQRHISCR